MPLQDADQYGSFIATTKVWDDFEIEETNVNSQKFKEMLVRLNIYVADIANILNIKDTGRYDIQEFVTGQVYFSNPLLDSSTAQVPTDRQTIRKVIYYAVALPNTGSVTINHEITCTGQTTFTRIYGVANDTTNKVYLPLPYASPTDADNIELKVDATQVTITTGSNRSAFTKTYIVLEYLQN